MRLPNLVPNPYIPFGFSLLALVGIVVILGGSAIPPLPLVKSPQTASADDFSRDIQEIRREHADLALALDKLADEEREQTALLREQLQLGSTSQNLTIAILSGLLIIGGIATYQTTRRQGQSTS